MSTDKIGPDRKFQHLLSFLHILKRPGLDKQKAKSELS